jgi:fructokinase
MILVVGEALVDLTLSADGGLASHLGGGPFNTARALGRLDVPVGFLGRLSNDVFGRRLRAALADDGVDTTRIVDTDDPTTLALAELDEHGHASYRFYLQGTSVPGLTAAQAMAAVRTTVEGQPIDALHVGTLALVVEPFATASAALVEAMAGDVLVLVDPNVRPAVIADRASYLTRLDGVLARADVVKVSDDDLAWMRPDDAIEPGARALLALGPRLVLVTMGARGALVVTRDGTESVPAPAAAVVDTIGAGDTFAAGVLAWWHDHDRPDLGHLDAAVAATRFACAVAGITVQRAGADPPRRAELP